MPRQPIAVLSTSSRRLSIALAIGSSLGFAASAFAGIESLGDGIGREFIVPTSGATALSGFTRASTGTNPVRGGYSLGGDSLTIGDTVYSRVTSGTAASLTDAGDSVGRVGQYFGRSNAGSQSITREPLAGADRVVYWYHEVGSVNGVLDVARSGGILPFPTNGLPTVSSGNPLWYMGNRNNARPTQNQVLGNGYSYPYNWTGGATDVSRPKVNIAWSDVRFEEAFSLPATTSSPAAATRRPLQPGYGVGRALPGVSNNVQSLDAVGNLTGGLDPSTTRLRNESLAVIPFTISSNPGTGLSKLSENDVRFLQTAGRLANGANFNFVARDAGSGTRNAGANSIEVDPAWASGDRIADASIGQNSRVVGGVEASPTAFNNNADRPSATTNFTDKTSGSSRVRVNVLTQRMSLGVLSATDVNAISGGGRGTLSSAQTVEPINVMKIDFIEKSGETDAGFVLPNAINTTEGRYHMWSSSVAVTVAPYANPSANDLLAGNEHRPIVGDENDQANGGTGGVFNPTTGANITTNAQPGIARKFLDNITRSVAQNGQANSTETPFDSVIAGGFISPTLMGVKFENGFEGDRLVARTRTAQEQADWDLFIGSGQTGTIGTALNFAEPAGRTGNLNDQALRYNLFAPGNNQSTQSASEFNGRSNVSIDVEARTVLAGDFNGDAARDLADVEALALAYANPSAFLATPTTGAATTNALGQPRNYNGLEVASLESATQVRNVNRTATDATPTSLTLQVPGAEGLVVLSDLNGNGNVTATGTDSGTVAPIERTDVRYFLWGATVDTTGFADKMGDGVRLGQLKKNAAVDRFNAELDDLAADGIITSTVAASLKFDKFDVNGDGVANRADAILVDRNVGKNFTVLDDVLSTWDDLVAAELTDDNVIRANGATSDFGLIRAALGTSKLLDGDANFDGVVNFDDLLVLASNYNASVDRWSKGDFNLDGIVNFDDLLGLAGSYNSSVPGGLGGDWALALASVPEPTSLAAIGFAGAGILSRRRRTK